MRLELMKPSTQIVAKCLKEHPPQLSPGMADLAKALHARGTVVYLVSGGFRSMIYPVAKVRCIHCTIARIMLKSGLVLGWACMVQVALVLHACGTVVYLVSGGFRSMIYPVAKV